MDKKISIEISYVNPRWVNLPEFVIIKELVKKYLLFFFPIGDPIPIQSLSISNYNRSNPTKVLIHGFSDKGLTSWVKNFKKVPFIYDVTIFTRGLWFIHLLANFWYKNAYFFYKKAIIYQMLLNFTIFHCLRTFDLFYRVSSF